MSTFYFINICENNIKLCVRLVTVGRYLPRVCLHDFLPGIRVIDAINLRKGCYWDEIKQELEDLDDSEWKKIAKEVERHYTKDSKTELER